MVITPYWRNISRLCCCSDSDSELAKIDLDILIDLDRLTAIQFKMAWADLTDLTEIKFG